MERKCGVTTNLVTIDDREPSALKKHFKGWGEVARLEFGDFSFLGNGPEGSIVPVGIERKSISDLINSMTSGRLVEHQIPGLLREYEYGYLMVEGIWEYDRDGFVKTWRSRGKGIKALKIPTGVKASAVANFLNSLMVLGGIKVVRTQGIKNTADQVKWLFNWWQKDWDEHHSYEALRAIPGGTDGLFGVPLSTVGKIAAQLPGVGIKRAREVSKRFKSVREMCDASEKDWMEVPGIGGTTARRAIVELNGASG